MPSEDWLRGERKSWEGPGGQVLRITLHAPACLGECSSFTNSWVDSGMVLGVLRSDQHYWLSWLLWLSDGASEQTQRSRVRAYRGTLALGVQWHLFCCLCGGSASCLRSEEGRQLSLPSGPRDPLSREHFTNLWMAALGFGYLSPLEGASKQGVCSQGDRARGKPPLSYTLVLWEIRASKTERQPRGAHLSP